MLLVQSIVTKIITGHCKLWFCLEALIWLRFILYHLPIYFQALEIGFQAFARLRQKYLLCRDSPCSTPCNVCWFNQLEVSSASPALHYEKHGISDRSNYDGYVTDKRSCFSNLSVAALPMFSLFIEVLKNTTAATVTTLQFSYCIKYAA